jgi:hypothetical protein
LGNYANPASLDDEPLLDGGQAIRRSAGSGRTYYMSSGWQFNVSGLYQFKWFDLSGNLFGRQGYPQPYYNRINLGAFEGRERVLGVSAIDEVRLDNLFLFDIRVAKDINFASGRAAVTVAAEIFNLFNAGTTNSTVVDASSPSFLRIDEILSPRIVRLVAKFRF